MTATSGPTQVRDAATVVVLREGSRGPETLMLLRHAGSAFMPRVWVFPGGAVDEADRRLGPARWRGIDPDALVTRFAMPADRVLGMHVAAVRETFEEAGLLLAEGAPAVVDQAGRTAAPGGFGPWLARQGLVLDLGTLTYWSRWVTPAGAPRRFDTCFFLARAVAGQAADHDRVETTAQRWVTPAEALDGDLRLVFPTERTLEDLTAFDGVAEAIAYGRAQSRVRVNEPRLARGPDGKVFPVLER